MIFTKPEWAWQALEAEIDRLRAELADMLEKTKCCREAQARLAAVLALCDSATVLDIKYTLRDKIRAAATGDTG